MQIGFTELLAVTFVVLNPTSLISWPWLWVICPALIAFSFVFLLSLVAFLASL